MGALTRSMRLGAGVLGKGRAGFFRFRQAQFAGRYQFQAEGREEFAEFLELTRIMRRQHQAITGTEARDGHGLEPSNARRMSFQSAEFWAENSVPTEEGVACSPTGVRVDAMRSAERRPADGNFRSQLIMRPEPPSG